MRKIALYCLPVLLLAFAISAQATTSSISSYKNLYTFFSNSMGSNYNLLGATGKAATIDYIANHHQIATSSAEALTDSPLVDRLSFFKS